MNKTHFSSPIPLKNIRLRDAFWEQKGELVRREVIPYQWEALNDRIPGAAPSYCLHNFRAAVRQKQSRQEEPGFTEPQYTFRGFESLPEDPQHPDDRFYGFVFQDSDVYKWLEAVAYSLHQHPDPELEALADGTIDLICAAQQEDGYLDTYYILNGKSHIFTNLQDHHELYCLGHLIEGAVAYYEATGKKKLLNAACRFADYVARYFGDDEEQCRGYPGHELAEMALIRLYRATGNREYLRLSLFFLNQRGQQPNYFLRERHDADHGGGQPISYYQAHKPIREQTEAVGHAVRAVYLYSGMASAAKETEDDSLFAACQTLWDSVTRRKMYITGGIGATHMGEAFSFDYDLPNDTAYAETCASIGLVFWARRMLELDPDGRYADVMERALYNGILSGMALDGKSFFYVNPLEVLPKACHQDERKAHVKAVRQKWFGCACCPPNLARLLTSISAYAYTANEETLFVHQYIGAQMTVGTQELPVSVSLESRFPWEGLVSLTANSHGRPYTIALRIPDWCTDWEVTLTHTGGFSSVISAKNFGQLAGVSLEKGYLYLNRVWYTGDRVGICFPMSVRIMAANSHVREAFGRVAVSRGPLVYCSEEVDNGAMLHLLSLHPGSPSRQERTFIAGEPVVALTMEGERTAPQDILDALYFPAKAGRCIPASIRLVPYYAWGNRGENEMSVWLRRKAANDYE